MSQVTAGAGRTPSTTAPAPANPALSAENIRLPEGLGDRVAVPLLLAGLVGLVLTVVGAFVHTPEHAVAAYQVGMLTALAMTLGGLFWTMIHHITNAGWSVNIRRVQEQIAGQMGLMIPVVAVFVLVEILTDGTMMRWMHIEDHFTKHKAGYLNAPFFGIRAAIYLVVWYVLASRLRAMSLDQDRTGDRWLSVRSRWLSAPGLLLFALTVAFASFDWIMTLDHRFFSTMFGVYFFAGAAYSGMALTILICSLSKALGRLRGVVTEEHYHDMGKWLFGFTVFWAYIGFSQYFLIWYANIPEETVFIVQRNTGEWRALSYVLAFGHFILPFFVLISRHVKRNPALLAAFALWAIAMQAVDMIWLVRPHVYSLVLDPAEIPGASSWWLDAAGLVGVLGIYFGVLAKRVGSGSLIPLRDPRQHESMNHANYV